MSASGTSRTNRRHQVLSPIGLTTDKGGFRRELAVTRLTQSGHRPSGRWNVIPCWGLEYVPWRCAMPSRIIALTIALTLSASTAAIAQSNSTDQSTNAKPSGSVMQPQGTTGPINTKSIGGAPASSPQGETPPGMQAAPKGSDKTMRTDTSGIPEGTPTK